MQNTLGSNVESLIKVVDDRVEILEFRVRDNCKFIDKQIKDLKLKDGILISYIIHKSIPKIANGNSVISLGDTVIITSHLKGLRDINDVLA